MPAPLGTTAINIGWTTSVKANCTYGGTTANDTGTSHYVTRPGLSSGFSETQTISCTDIIFATNTASTSVSISVQGITITGLNYTDQNAVAITSMPAPFGTTAINVGWTTNLNANCTYGGATANGDGTTSHYVTRPGLSSGFNETQSISCTDVASSANTASTTVSISVQ
jgi:hypothetical protein